MGMVVRTNTMAQNAYRQLGMNNTAVGKSLEKLSSGFRINRAADDASGLAISEKMKAQIKGLEQASANSQDGISLIQTAEGATTEIHNMLNRMTELATKSANGTIQNEVDRQAIQKEVNDLNDEITRIAESTNFNGINLLNGNLAGGAQGSGALSGGVVSKFKPATTAATAGNDMSGFTGFSTKEKINIDGVEIEVDWTKLSAEEQTALKKDWSATGTTTATEAKSAADILQKTINNAIDTANKTRGTNVSHIEVKGVATGAATTAATFQISSTLANSKDSKISISGSNTGVMGTMLAGSTPAGAANGTAANTALTAPGAATVDGTTLTLSNLNISAKNGTDLTGAEATAINNLLTALTTGNALSATTDTSGEATFTMTGYTLEGAGGAAATLVQGATGTFTIKNAAGDVLGTFDVVSGGAAGGAGATTSAGDLSFTGGSVATASTAAPAVPGTDISAVATDKFSGDVADVNGVDFDMVLGGESINIRVGGISAANNDGTANATAIKTAIDTALDNYILSKGLSATEGTALKSNLSVEFTKDGRFNITNNSGKTLSFKDKDGGKAAETLGIGGESGVVTSGGLKLQVGDTNAEYNHVTVSVDDLSAKGIGTAGLNVSNQDAAGDAIDVIKKAINQVSTNRANLGSLQNRLEYTINNLDTTAENMTAANSRIRDTDMAKEMMTYTKMNILTQSAQAMLAQANQAPQAILQLLQ